MIPINDNWVLNNHDNQINLHCSKHHLKHHNIGQSLECFTCLRKTSKQSLISILFYIGRGDIPLLYPPPARHFVPRSRASPLLTQTQPPTHNFLDPPLGSSIAHSREYQFRVFSNQEWETRTVSQPCCIFALQRLVTQLVWIL